MSQAAKYWEKYQQKQAQMKANLMTDKQAYIASLEAQLEKVTQSLLINQGFVERVEQLQAQINTSEDRIVNLTRLVKLQQSYNEEQEKTKSAGTEIIKIDPKISQRLDILEEKVRKLFEKATHDIEEKQIRLKQTMENNTDSCDKEMSFGRLSEGFGSLVDKMIEVEKRNKDAVELAWNSQQTCNKLSEDMLERMAACENKVNEFKMIKDSGNIEQITKMSKIEIENLIEEKVSVAVDKIVAIIKNYGKTQEEFETKIKKLNQKIKEIVDGVKEKQPKQILNKSLDELERAVSYEKKVPKLSVKKSKSVSPSRSSSDSRRPPTPKGAKISTSPLKSPKIVHKSSVSPPQNPQGKPKTPPKSPKSRTPPKSPKIHEESKDMEEEKKVTMKKPDIKAKRRKHAEKRNKLEQLYQQLSARNS